MARIILVDDDPVIGQLVAVALLDAGHAIGWMEGGQAELAVMRARARGRAAVPGRKRTRGDWVN